MHSQLLISFFAYLCILLAIGLISHRKQKTSADFIMGNRSLNFWLTALSAHASDMSAWLFMGFPAAIFIGGLSNSWIAFGLVTGMWLTWQFVAKKLRTQTEKYDSYTLSTFFENRFGDRSGTLRILTAAITVFFLTCYLAAGLIAMGLLFQSTFGIDYYIGLSVATFVIMLYVFVGGFVTVAWTDLFQALFLMCVIVVVPIIAYMQMDNAAEQIASIAQAKNISLNFLKDTSPMTLTTYLFVASWGLGYFGMPHVLTKFMGIKNANDMNKSKYVGITWQIIVLSAATCIGLVGIAFFKDGLPNPELIFIEMVKVLFNPLLAGFILCAVLAANMSTMDSIILVCASVLSEDVYKRMIRKNAGDRELLRVSRGCVVGIALFSLLIAFNKESSVLEAVKYAWNGLGASFGPLVIMSLYSANTNKYGAIAGVITGSVVSGLWNLVNGYVTELTVPSIIPGFFLSFAAIYVVSVVTGREKALNATF